MGHAGAIVSGNLIKIWKFDKKFISKGGKGGAKEKIAHIEKHGIRVSKTPADLGKTMLEAMKEAGLAWFI